MNTLLKRLIKTVILISLFTCFNLSYVSNNLMADNEKQDQNETKKEEKDDKKADVKCYGSSKSEVYHKKGCGYIDKIKSSNLVEYKNEEEAKSKGKRLCKKCGG